MKDTMLTDSDLDKIEARLAPRFDRIEKKLDEHTKRLDGHDKRFDAISGQLAFLITKIGQKHEKKDLPSRSN